MQQVARIRPAGRREALRAVTLADGRRFLLEAEQVTFLGLSPETAVDEGLERRLVNLDERIRAREAALTLLRYRLRGACRVRRRRGRTGCGPGGAAPPPLAQPAGRGAAAPGGGAAAAPRLFPPRGPGPPAPLPPP